MKGILLMMLAAFTLWGGFQGWGVSPSLESGQAYRASLAPPHAEAMLAKAQALGWWIRVQQGAEVSYYQGSERCAACAPALEGQFFGFPQLALDGAVSMVRLDTAAFRLNLRPMVDGGLLYELVVVMKQTLDAEALTNQIQQELSALGLILPLGLSFEALPLSARAKAPVPQGVRLDETLFRLTQAPDWPDFATLQGLSLSGLRVRAVVELAEGQTPSARFDLLIEGQGSSGMRTQVLIPDLLALAQDPAVAQVRAPLQPQAGGGS
ncbi:MAG TPA: hypothetical protein VIL47_00660 [Candidatus Bipolaricaulota bacterium]